MWSFEIGKQIRQLNGHTRFVSSVCVTSDSRYIISGSYDKSVRVWSLEQHNFGEQIKKLNIPSIDVIVRGIGSGRESAIRTLASKGINILCIRDATPIPHNGPRPPKVRRV